MISRDKQFELITKLIQLTNARKVAWRQTSARRGAIPTPDDLDVFDTTVDGQRLRLRVPSPVGSLGRWASGENWPATIEFLDSAGDVVWSMAGISALSDLVHAVRRSESDVEDAIDRILKIRA